MTCGSSMLAMIFTAPPQCWQDSISMPKTRLSRRAQLIDTSVVGETYDVLATWREKAMQVQGSALPCQHTLQEEAPGATADALLQFFYGERCPE
jgi:hypothetical protein